MPDKKILFILKNLRKNDIEPPPREYEKAHTFPVSLLPLWPKVYELCFVPDLVKLPNAPAKIYIHVPFCISRCAYCFYTSIFGAKKAKTSSYLTYLRNEIEMIYQSYNINENPAQVVYFGGGTPTYLPKEKLGILLNEVIGPLRLTKDATLCIETHPRTTTPEKIDILQDYGINRVSIGVQSFDDAVLRSINRVHDSKDAIRGIKLLTKSFDLVNVDLMFNLPHQSMKSWLESVRTCINLGVPEITLLHMRVNPLTFIESKPNGFWFREVRMMHRANRLLYDHGYLMRRPHHWVSKDMVSKFEKYRTAPCTDHRNPVGGGYQVGLGPSAISHVGYDVYMNHTCFETYSNMISKGNFPVERFVHMRMVDLVARRLIIGLVDKMGLKGNEIGLLLNPLESEDKEFYKNQIAKLLRCGVIKWSEGNLMLTHVGCLVYDEIQRALYPPDWQERARKLLFSSEM